MFAKLVASASSTALFTPVASVDSATWFLYVDFSSSDKYVIASISACASAFCPANSSAALASATICSTASVASALVTCSTSVFFWLSSRFFKPSISSVPDSLALVKFWLVASVTICVTSAMVVASVTCCSKSVSSSADKYVKSAIVVSAAFCASANANSAAPFASTTAFSTVATSVALLACSVYVVWSPSDRFASLPISFVADALAFVKLLAVASATILSTSAIVVASSMVCVAVDLSVSDKYVNSLIVSVASAWASCNALSSATFASATICSTVATVSASGNLEINDCCASVSKLFNALISFVAQTRASATSAFFACTTIAATSVTVLALAIWFSKSVFSSDDK